MNIQDKKLLVQDLMARIPYGVYVEHIPSGIILKPTNIAVFPLYKGNEINDYLCEIDVTGNNNWDKIENFKPYLFDMKSLTKEQWEEQSEILHTICHSGFAHAFAHKLTDFYNKHHIDYHDLIFLKLANDASKTKIY